MEDIDRASKDEVMETMIMDASRPRYKRRTVFGVWDFPNSYIGEERATKYMFEYFNPFKLGLDFKGVDEMTQS